MEKIENPQYFKKDFFSFLDLQKIVSLFISLADVANFRSSRKDRGKLIGYFGFLICLERS